MVNEKWLIEPEMLKTKLYEICDEYNTDRLHIDRIIDEIDDATTVDAVEVVHGRWVKCKDWDYDYKCSVCEGYAGEDGDGDHYKLTPYCPNCGAKMDGDGIG